MSVDQAIKILLVEDSKITRKMEIKALKGAGFSNIVEADDGDDAIVKLREHTDVSLILSDWNMPNKSGIELLIWVRADEACKNIPFIMATAQSEKKQTVMATEAGVSNFISKPFGPPELTTVIEDTFSGKAEEAKTQAAKPMVPQRAASGKALLRAAHIQITDHLTLGVVKHNIETEKMAPKHFELETTCMPGWNPVQQALENGEIDAAFILAPIAMDLFSFDVPIKLVLFAHKNGSVSVRKKSTVRSAAVENSFRNKTFFIPHILSIHHMLSSMLLKELGLKPGLAGEEGVDAFFEVVPPVKMPELLGSNPDAGGFTVAEPLGTKAIASGNAELLFLSGELWEYHPCCVVVFRDEFIKEFPEAVKEFTEMLVESGQFISEKPEQAAEIAVDFLDPQKKLGLNVPVLKNVLNEPQGIKTDDLYPVVEDLERIQNYMVDEMGIGTRIDVKSFVDTRFADDAYKNSAASRHSSVVKDISKVVAKIRERGLGEGTTKANLDREGKYLFFSVASEEYGVSVLSIKEIISMMVIKTVPNTPSYIKGVINLRGKVIPVIDMRSRFDLEECEYDKLTCIVVLENTIAGNKMTMGAIVDSVSDVITIKASDIVDTPEFGTGIATDYIMAMAKMDRGVKSLLNVERMFSDNDNELIGNIV